MVYAVSHSWFNWESLIFVELCKAQAQQNWVESSYPVQAGALFMSTLAAERLFNTFAAKESWVFSGCLVYLHCIMHNQSLESGISLFQ